MIKMFERCILMFKLAFKFAGSPISFLSNLNAHNFRVFLLHLKTTNAATLEKMVDDRLKDYKTDSLKESELTGLESIFRERFNMLSPLRSFYTPKRKQRLNLVTDSVNSGSLYGGVGTAIILSALLANRWDCDLRIITRTEIAQKRNLQLVLNANAIPFARNVEFLFAPYTDLKATVPVNDGDVFLTTSWWVTKGVKEVFSDERIIYLLQEDERVFYPLGDDYFLCSEVLGSQKLQFVINTELLYNHLVSNGFENIHENGVWFEPSFPQDLFFCEQKPPQAKKNFFFYARPLNLRNLFYLGLNVIKEAVETSVLDLNEWNLHFVGKDITRLRITLAQGCPFFYENLNWLEYAGLVRKMDLGLCLMLSPHPGYSSLDLAASGAVVVTNQYGDKKNLNKYSKNIICSELGINSLLSGIETGVEMTANSHERIRNYKENKILRDWGSSFEPVLERLKRWPANVSD